ncbi:MAG: tripartite tricarboxylate transporter TctB family protein [bacterium]
MNKRLTELLIIVAFMVLAVLLYRDTAGYPVSVQGSTAAYVRFLGTSLGVLCVIQFVSWVMARDSNKKEPLGVVVDSRRFWGLLILLVLYSSSLGLLGFYLSSALFLPLTMYVMGSRRFLAIGGTSVGVLLFIYVVFGKLLGVFLPEATLFRF